MKKSNMKKLWKEIYHYRMIYLMLLPGIVATFIFEYIPLYGVQIAFKNYRTSKGIWGSPWIGFEHFIRFFNYPYFGQMIWNTLRISLIELLGFPLPIILAIMFNEMRNEKLKKVCQTITYAPHFLSTVLVCSMCLLFLNSDGLYSTIRGFFGLEPVNLMASAKAFPWIYFVSGVWQGVGFGTVLYLATLAGVSQELVEAATIDGATRMQVIRHVHFPHLKGTILIQFILRMGGVLSVGFEKVFLLKNSLNQESASVISIYTYEMGLLGAEFSYSAAIGLFNNVISILMVLLTNFAVKCLGDTSLF